METEEKCDVCYKIICKACGWEAGEEETLRIQSGELVACPTCGWSPGGNKQITQ